MTEVDQGAKMLERVRALLAKASSTTFPEEADSFRAKADELMTKYAIEVWQVEQAEAGKKAPTKPIVRKVDLAWWYDMDNQLASGLWDMFISVTTHCRVRTAWKNVDYMNKQIPLVGMPVDLDYADMLFTNLMLQLVDTMDPHPKSGEPMIEALVRMKEAGLKWEEIYRRLQVAGYFPYDQPWQPSKMDFAGKYTRYCQQHGRERVRTTPTVYRRSFASGFTTAIRQRLRLQREEQGQNTGSMAVAIRDISQVVEEALFDFFPNQAERTRSRAVARGNPLKTDLRVMGAGVEAGNKARIMGKGDKDLAARKQIR